MKIAFCADHPIFQTNRMLNSVLSKDSPDTAWAAILAKLARQNFEVTTGDLALSYVQAGRWKPYDILIIQLLDSSDGRKLARLGAIPFVLIGAESPLYAYNFYKELKKIAPIFRYRFLFSGIFKNLKSTSNFSHPLHFPSFHIDKFPSEKKWGGRNFLVMVADNKYYKKNFPIIPKYKSEHLDWLKEKFLIWQSPIRKKAIDNELITKRLEAVSYFGSQNLLHLFGSGWDKLENLPIYWQIRLKNVIAKIHPKSVRRKDKIMKIAGYKFAVCFENTSFPGYVTEKIIDCFAAGVIPVYLGAPDITKFVPANSFINMRNFNSFNRLHKYLTNISKQEALAIISQGKDFLKSPKGKLYSHENMAEFVLKLAIKTAKN